MHKILYLTYYTRWHLSLKHSYMSFLGLTLQPIVLFFLRGQSYLVIIAERHYDPLGTITFHDIPARFVEVSSGSKWYWEHFTMACIAQGVEWVVY